MPTPRQLFYFDPTIIDLDKLREDANKAAKGDVRNEPVSATIHYHRMQDSCEGKQHEHYKPEEK